MEENTVGGQVALRRVALQNYMLVAGVGGGGGIEEEKWGHIEGTRLVPLVNHR
jgi:hypothetical protein